MTAMASLSQRLTERGLPSVRAQAAHPTVAGIARGDLDPAVFRSWLEQDYLFLLDYVRVFARLAWQAPDGHLGDLVDLAHSTWHEELALHRSLAAEFDADLFGAVAGPATAAYTGFLLEAADGLRPRAGRAAAVHVGLLDARPDAGRAPAARASGTRAGSPPTPTPASPRWPAGARRCSTRRTPRGWSTSRPRPTAFDAAMRHELAFWDVR